MSATYPVTDREQKILTGDVFLCCGCALVTLESGNRYLLEDQDFCGLVAGLFREFNVTDHMSTQALAAVEVGVIREQSIEYSTAGEGFPAHRVPSTEYRIDYLLVRMGVRSIYAKADAREELVGLEIGKEFQ